MRAANPGPGGGWVSKYEMVGMGHRSYRERIRDLRQAGNRIESRRELAGKKRDTCYRLVKKAEAQALPVASGGGDAVFPRPEHVERPQIEAPPGVPEASVGRLFQELRRWVALGNWIEQSTLGEVLTTASQNELGTKEAGLLRRKDGAVDVEARFERGTLAGDSFPAEWIAADFWRTVQAIRFNGLVSARFEGGRMVRGDLWETFGK